MPSLTRSADELISEVSASVKTDLYASIAPITKRIVEAVTELERALSQQGQPRRTAAAAPRKKAATRKGRRGRPRKNASATVESAAKKTVKATARKTAVPRGGKRIARGALQSEVLGVLKRAGGEMNLTQIRNEVMKIPAFKKRDANSLYSQITQALKKSEQVQKVGKGTYRSV